MPTPAPCQELKNELNRIDAAVKAARERLRRATPPEKFELIGELNSLLQDENSTGLAFFECLESHPTQSGASIDPVDAFIPLDSRQQFTALAHFTNNTSKPLTDVTWVSSDPSVASISNTGPEKGQAKGLHQGRAIITATDPSGVTIRAATLNVGLVLLAVTPPAGSMNFRGSPNGQKDREQFVATGTFADGSTGVVTDLIHWESSDLAVATISTTGATRGLAIAPQGGFSGAAAITASTTNTTGAKVTAHASLTVS